MKFYQYLLLLVRISMATSKPMNGCWRQSNCIIFTTEKIYNAATCSFRGDCEYKICAELDLTNPDCEKVATDTVSHTCVKDDTTCNDGGGFANAVETKNVSDNHKQCQTVPASGIAEFIFMDGGGCAGEEPSRLGNTLAMCAPTTEETGTGTGNVGKECVWTAEAPPCYPSIKASPAAPPQDDDSCLLYTLDFNTGYISPGQYITDELKADYKVTITATGGYSPNGAARIFDTSNPGTKEDGDPDLGSPNKGCPGFDPPGPGEGDGGKPGTYHHNCIPQGNVLIIQEENKKTPDDNGGGGTLTFDFDEAVKLDNLKILDVDDNGKTPKVLVTLSDGFVIQFEATEVGDNGVDTIDIDLVDVTSVKVEFPGSGAVAELNYRICPDVTDVTPAPTVSPTASPTSSLTGIASPTHDDTCPFYNLDFDESYVSAGDYITNQFEADYFVTVLASGGYTPGGAARIFDSSNPGTREDGDPDLGSPNEKCNVEGLKPGVGDGGAPGSVGENCVALGNLLIVQEGNKATPDDNAGGGRITFTFTKAAKVEDVKLLDVDLRGEEPKIKIITMDGSEFEKSAPKVGDNGVSVIPINKIDVASVTVTFDGSGSVAELNYHICPTTASPTANPVSAITATTFAPYAALPTPAVTAGPRVSPTASPTHDGECPYYNLDFDESYVIDGDYITNQFESEYFVTILASGGFTPEGAARIFNSSTCDEGENCAPFGNLLIIQESDKPTPDDNDAGGEITFAFTKAAKVEDVELVAVDMTGEGPKITVVSMDGSVTIFDDHKMQDNEVSLITVNQDYVASVTVTFAGSGSIAELNYHICPSDDSTAPSPTASPIASPTVGLTTQPTVSPTVSPTHDGDCPFYNLDFDESYVSAGDYITNQFENEYFVSVSASGGFTPGGAARIFDSSNPGNEDNGDPDLGSPNEKCDLEGPKPGKGEGGAPGTVGENCVPLGNILIVQESDKSTPDDNAGGGIITFTFSTAAKVEDVKLLDVDMDGEEPKVTVVTMDGSETVFNAQEVGDNGINFISINQDNVISVIVAFDGSGSVAELNYHICPSTSTLTASTVDAVQAATSAPSTTLTPLPTIISPTSSPTAMEVSSGDVKNGVKDALNPGQYSDGSCMEDFWLESGEDTSLICRTLDIQLDSLVAIGEATCKVGEFITVSISGNLLFTEGPTKFDLGWYVASDGGDALTGTCAVKTLAEDADPAINGTVAWVGEASGSNDVCGDVSGDVNDLELATDIHIMCMDQNEDGHADVSICLGWKEMDDDSVCDPSRFLPGSVTSCNCATFDLMEIIALKTSTHSTCI